jgi:hypothetical protein
MNAGRPRFNPGLSVSASPIDDVTQHRLAKPVEWKMVATGFLKCTS